MGDSCIYRANGTGPAVHALVIGVGHYPHLIGGGGPPMTKTEGMGQLTSAPVSARMFAEWLLAGMRNPAGRPLATLRLLVSEKPARPFRHALLNTKAKPRPATGPEVDQAILEWRKDLDSDEGNLGVFFFSGHGVTAGLNQGLLLSDLGVNDGDPFASAIRLEGFHLGMGRTRAREQVYFIDACRSHSYGLADTYGGGGRVYVTPDPSIVHSRPRAAPIFNATLQGEKAFGVRKKPSFFTQALLDAFEGAGSDNTDDENVWLVETATLSRGVEFLVGEAGRRFGLTQAQVTPTDHASRLELHRLSGAPKVPVSPLFEPAPAPEKVGFFWPGGKWTAGDPLPFLPYGPYPFTARAPGPPPVSGVVQKTVRPPYSRLKFLLGGAAP